MRAGIEKGFRGFATAREDGALMGPWNPWLHEPRIGRAVWELIKALSVVSTLPDPCRQIAILVTGAHFHAGYEIYAHVAVAQRDGLSDEAISTVVAGQRPADLPRYQAIAYDTAAALLRGGVLPQLNYQLAAAEFGTHGRACASGGPILHDVRHPQRLRRPGAGGGRLNMQRASNREAKYDETQVQIKHA